MHTIDRDLIRQLSKLTILVATCGILGVLSPPADAQDAPVTEPPAVETPPQETPDADAADSDPYAVPEANDAASIRKFVERMAQLPSPDRTPAGLRAHFGKLEQAADALLARDVEEAGVIEVIRLKIGALGILEQLGDVSADKRRQELIGRLKQDERPGIAVHGRLLDLESQTERLQPRDAAGAQKLIDQVVTLLQEKPLTDAHVSVAYSVAEKVEAEMDAKLATAAYRVFAKYLKASENPNYVSLATTFEGAARRLNLIGNPVEITGKTLDGEPFDIKQWQGKVVLVDFWATWCGPCIEEMPNLKALYEKHHGAGFEIVGVNLDDNLGRVGAFVRTQELAWPQLASEKGQDSEIANYYGVYTIPTTFLVGRDGKVTAIDLFGEDLEEEVVRLVNGGTGS